MAGETPDDPAAKEEARLKAIRARADKATPGPWTVYDRGGCGDHDVDGPKGPEASELSGRYRGMFCRADDAEFVAHARADIPWLLDRLAAAERERDAARDFLRDVATNYDHDSDAHKYGTRCRVCEAEKLLSSLAPAPARPAQPTDTISLAALANIVGDMRNACYDGGKMVKPDVYGALGDVVERARKSITPKESSHA